jgi:hypothetical protein
MTSDRKLDMSDFLQQSEVAGRRNITDLFISIKDIAVIVEVKRSEEDCKAQLYNQVLPFIKSAEVRPVRCSWQDVVLLLERVRHVEQLLSQDAQIIRDFLELSEIRYPYWFEPKPFNTIAFTHNGNPQLTQRLKQALAGISGIAGDDYQLLPYSDRLGIALPFGWVSEFIPFFAHHNSDGVDYVDCCIWPANTKTQGYHIFTSKSLDWTKKKDFIIDGKPYSLSVEYEVKLSHFNGYITSITYSDADIVKQLHTPENYAAESGRWKRPSWNELEELFDKHFKPEFRWREQCGWAEHFVDTDRSYLTMSLGFVVTASIPFSRFKAIDKKEADVAKVSSLLWKTALALKDLIN